MFFILTYLLFQSQKPFKSNHYLILSFYPLILMRYCSLQVIYLRKAPNTTTISHMTSTNAAYETQRGVVLTSYIELRGAVLEEER